VTDAQALYAFHRDPRDGLIGRCPLGEVGAILHARESNLNHLEIVGRWEQLLSFPDGRSAAFECSKGNDDCKATCHAIASGAAELTRNLPRPRSLDPDLTDWDPDDMDTWDERIVMVADDEDFLEWQRDWRAENGRG
jgi:hypothetical protein